MLVKVMSLQTQLGRKLSLDEKLLIFKQKADFICLPEYFLVSEDDLDFARSALQIKENLDHLVRLSEDFSTCLIGGSVIEAEVDSLFNCSYLIQSGKILGRYRKLNPVTGEIVKGVLPGDKIFTYEVDGIRIAILICADALNLELFRVLAIENVDIIFIPTISPYRPGEMRIEKYKRDNDIFVQGALLASSFIVKTGGVGTLFDKRLQGRSLIAAPWGILKRVEPYSENSRCILTEVLDIDEIRDFRLKKRIVDDELVGLGDEF